MATKIELLNSAYSWMRISGLTVDPTPEDIELGLYRMEDMMAEFYGRTVNLGFIFEETPDPNSESGVDPIHNKMISSNLALELCPDFGKDIPMRLNQIAGGSWTASVAVVARDRANKVAYPNRMPLGAGNRASQYLRRFNPTIVKPVSSGDNVTMTAGDINNFSEDFATFLSAVENAEILSYTVKTSTGLNVVANALSADKKTVSYVLEALSISSTNSSEMVEVSITTNNGRVDTRERAFAVSPKQLRA